MKKIRLITNILSVIMIVGYIAYLIIIWQTLPDTLPKHFDAKGVADAYGSKMHLIFEPILMILLFLLLAIVELFPGAWNTPVKITEKNRDRQMLILSSMLGGIKICCVLLCMLAGLASIRQGISIVWILVPVGGIFLIIAVGIGLSIRYE